MELKWNWDAKNKMASAYVDNTLHYKTPDGGQTIHKYVNNALVKTFHKYGSDKKFTDYSPSGLHTGDGSVDEWPAEVQWLADNYSNKLGEFNPKYDEGFRERDGSLVDAGKMRGFGVNNMSDKISVNRTLAAANITEWWDWDVVGVSPDDAAPECQGRGTIWRKNYKTGKIVRTSSGTPPFPCCCFPVIYGPWELETDLQTDLDKYNGKLL